MIETHVAENDIITIPIIIQRLQQSPLQNGKNAKSNCDINELPEGRFPLTI